MGVPLQAASRIMVKMAMDKKRFMGVILSSYGKNFSIN
jgi:hypothetical protein